MSLIARVVVILSVIVTGAVGVVRAVTDLTVTQDPGTGQVVLTWTATAGPYVVLRDINPNPNNLTSTILASALGSTTYSDGALNDGVNYFYLISDAPPLSLVLPQSTAFAILGHSCGGIQEKAFATAFDPASGYPTGDVYIETRCGGSGRGGGYQVTTYSAWVSVTWDFAGNVVSSTTLTTVPTVSSTFTATDAYRDQIYNSGTAAHLVIFAPDAPIGVTAIHSGDQFDVSWTPALYGVNPAAITSSTLTATPVDSTAPILTTIVNGSVENGVLGPLEPETTYEITVVSATIGGSGPASNPITLSTAAATVAPSAPPGVSAFWTSLDPSDATDTLVATWNAPDPGDSPIDQFEVTIASDEGAGTFTQTVPGTTLTAIFTVDYVPNWTVTVRAHNAVGWGPWSDPFILGGL